MASSLTLRCRVLAYPGAITGSVEAEEGTGEERTSTGRCMCTHCPLALETEERPRDVGTSRSRRRQDDGVGSPPEPPEVGGHPGSSAGLPGRKGDALKEGKAPRSLRQREKKTSLPEGSLLGQCPVYLHCNECKKD